MGSKLLNGSRGPIKWNDYSYMESYTKSLNNNSDLPEYKPLVLDELGVVSGVAAEE